ncbi:Methylthioribose-1-phosphate isomerase [Operophtera brumata]|uniref:Methylthioribose-1-phosphate isomerase n=1 Tax=Operophtera brumata TaxID=104452 RepID=A0A0L7KYI8_OPEBR|nr:Methylthioribose-1-phosphate isomerase [Operophtera brumata]
MVSALMNTRKITAVVVGADRIAIAAKYHGVPFYVAAPCTSLDMALASGDRVTIEERPDREMTHIGEHRIAAPAALITGIITERGVYAPDKLKEILQQ